MKKRMCLALVISLLLNIVPVFAASSMPQSEDDESTIEVMVNIVDENGNTMEYPVEVDIQQSIPTQNARTAGSNDETEYEATADFYVPLDVADENALIAPCLDEGPLTSPASGYVATGKVQLKYTKKDYSVGSTGILLNYVRVEYTITDSSASVTSVVTDYWCKGGNGDTTPGYVNQQNTKVGYSSPHSLSTGFTKYVLDGDVLTAMGCESVFNFKMGSTRTWTATVNVDYYSRT